ncbi:lipoprotein [soil metagenome]
MFHEGAATGAGVAGTALASKVTRNATVASGIGLGVLAAAQFGVKTVERNDHGDQQDQIAEIAGQLAVGQVARWQSRHTIQLEPDAMGTVTVSRLIGGQSLNCKEIVFSVENAPDSSLAEAAPAASFYVATICQDASKWKWASAEPATARWGALQ